LSGSESTSSGCGPRSAGRRRFRSCGLLAGERPFAQLPLLVDRQPAAVEVARLLDAVLEAGLLDALVERMRAARPELAAGRRADQRRRRALDRVQALLLRPVEPRDRAEQPPRVRMLWVVEEAARLRALHDP